MFNHKVFSAFQSKNYRLYFFGQSVSLIGTWMQRTAVYWLIYVETNSTLMLGMAVFCAQFPSFLLSIMGGVVSDRYNRFRVLLTTQIASLVQAALLTILVFSGEYEVWHILALSVVLGSINAFDVPARQSLVYDLVHKKEHLPNAIALNSSMVNVARLVGPALSGLVLEKFGAEICFLINTLSFGVVIMSLYAMKLPAFVPRDRITNIATDLKEGLHYIKSTADIRTVILLLTIISFVSLPYITLLPVYAKEIFEGNAFVFGLLNSFVGIGAVSGALFLASLSAGSNLKKILSTCTLVFGAGLMAFAFTSSLPLALLFITIAGFGMMSQTTITNTIIQTTVAPAMRGRVISYYAMAFFGMQPVGSLLIGILAEYIGAPLTIFLQGLLTLFIALVFMQYLQPGLFKKKQTNKLRQLEEQTIEGT